MFDFKNPQAYLALEPTRNLLAQLGEDAQWQPLLVGNARKPEQPTASSDRGAWHRWHRACYRQRDLRRYAAARGVPAANFDDAGLYRADEGKLAAAGFLWLQQHEAPAAADYLSRIYAGYWDGGLVLDDADQVRGIINSMGGRAAEFTVDDFAPMLEDLEQAQHALREQGYFDVPCYVVDDEVFYGRHHLPMVGWRLQGSVGPAPV